MGGRLLAISDLHVGYPENRAFAASLRPGDPDDWLIVAGDIGELFADVGFVLGSLANRFATVIWTPGNHELWTLPADPVAVRGVARYEALLKVCRRFGVLTPEDEFPVWPGRGPDGPVTIAPLFTLYDYSFSLSGDSDGDGDGDGDAPAATRARAIALARAAGVGAADENRLHPDPYPSVEAWCRDRVALSAARLASVTGPMVVVSHWPLLRAPVTALRHPEYAPWCGTELTAEWHRSFPVTVAVYGHLHVPRTTMHDGVRFEEVSVGYPREWQRRGAVPPQPRIVLGA
jgi:3',5'-cyclic AMP phosphodiesterase CpdA